MTRVSNGHFLVNLACPWTRINLAVIYIIVRNILAYR